MKLPRALNVPETKLGQFVFFFVSEFVCFFIIVADTRAIAIGSYLGATVTNVAFGMQAWLVRKLTVEHEGARSLSAGLGSTIGGTIGTLISIWATKQFYGR